MATLFHEILRRFMRFSDLHQLLLVAVMFMFAEVSAKAALAVVYLHHDQISFVTERM